jgi:hypothetical protein
LPRDPTTSDTIAAPKPIPPTDPLVDALWRDPERECAAPLDEEHARARAAVLARRGGVGRRHPVDVRFTVPLSFRRYFVVLLAGRDRRASVAAREADRGRARTHALGGGAFAGLSGLLFVAIAAFGVLALYGVKSFLGIDLFPDFHALDVFRSEFWIE